MDSSVKLITVVMIDSRSDDHPDWVQTAIESVKRQTFPVELLVVNNVGRQHTIGECFNKGVREAKSPWILFLGDDDWITPDFCALLGYYTTREDLKHVVGFTTNMTVFRNYGDETRYTELPRPHTGMWKREYLLKYPFNETLEKGIDREWIEEVEKRGDTKILIHYHAGYHYRQHDDLSCAGKISLKYETGEIYVNSRYPIHTTPYTERLKRHFKSVVVDNHPFTPAAAAGAKVIWCDWGNENAAMIGRFETDAIKILRIHAYEAFGANIHYIPFDAYHKVIFVAKHIKEYVERQLNRKLENAVVIPNGIDVKAFKPDKVKLPNKRIAFAGELSRKKGLPIALLIARQFPQFQFYFAGRFPEPDMAEYFHRTKPSNVHLEPFSYDLKEFFKDKTFYLNTSAREGCPVTVLQAMSAGLIPIVHEWVGAGSIFPAPYLFSNMKDVENILTRNHLPEVARSFVVKKHNIDILFDQYLDIFNEAYYGANQSQLAHTG